MTEVSTPPGFTIDLNDAVKVKLPRPRSLRPKKFKTPDGRDGWVVRIPDDRPLATPAFADGRLFLGGGYGSYQFYAFDAESGARLWQTKTSDDGPTAAVVDGRYVAFNTESCSIIVCDVETGAVVWERWLGDPLMSQPAIDQGCLYMAYPTGQRPPKDKKTVMHEGETTGHALLCVKLATGEQIWERPISGDVITAPVIDEGRVYVTCFDGRSYCFDGADGSVIWEAQNRGTSAPLVVGRRVIVTERQTDDAVEPGVPLERLHRLYAGSGSAYNSSAMARKMAYYLSGKFSGGSPVPSEKSAGLDAEVGFSSSPAAAKLDAAAMHLGVGSVAGAWAYQGSRPAYHNGRVFTAQGSAVHCVVDHGKDEDTETAWEGQAKGDRIEDGAQVFLPPALGGDCLYLAGMVGHLVCLRQDRGEVAFIYDFERAMSAQPCLARGSVFLGTLDGYLVCLRTGREDADGWYMWGGNARHNKTA